MNIGIQRHAASDGVVRLAVTGEVDMDTSDLLAAAIRDAILAGPIAKIVVDIDQVTFLDSSGIGTLVAGHHLALEHRIAYQVINPHGMVAETLDITGVLPALTEPGSGPSATG